jgi:hypothetical protein
MSNRKYLGMRSNDLEAKPYAKYWSPRMGPMQEHVQQALRHGIEAAELGFPVEEAPRLLEPGDLPLENGYTRLTNGQIFVAALTQMPRVTGEMIDWWFGWHYMEKERYKLWHPRAHVDVRAERMIGDDAGYTDCEKYAGNTHYITEYIGGTPQDITITFQEPESLGLDSSRFEAAGISAAVCGRVGYQKLPLEIAHLIHLIRETEDGSEMRSRFWLGATAFRGVSSDGLLNRLISSRPVADLAVSEPVGRAMLVHCAMEMNHLASFLPDLYADYHPAGT